MECALASAIYAIEGGKEQVIPSYPSRVSGLRGMWRVQFGAVDQTHFTEQQIVSQIDSLLANDPIVKY